MSWQGDLGDVAANRDAAFPPLHADDDDGTLNTVLSVRVPYKINPARQRQLLDSLMKWADGQGLTDYLSEDQVLLSSVDWPKDQGGA